MKCLIADESTYKSKVIDIFSKLLDLYEINKEFNSETRLTKVFKGERNESPLQLQASFSSKYHNSYGISIDYFLQEGKLEFHNSLHTLEIEPDMMNMKINEEYSRFADNNFESARVNTNDERAILETDTQGGSSSTIDIIPVFSEISRLFNDKLLKRYGLTMLMKGCDLVSIMQLNNHVDLNVSDCNNNKTFGYSIKTNCFIINS